MPFWSDAKTENYKSKLEHKMCIAKDAPELSFDLIDCNLHEVPPGVFSMCRVFLKESLYLDDNNLSSLHNGGSLKDLSRLQVLSLKNNKFSSLPEDISCLTQLKDLNLENNRLKKLPVSFGKLSNLGKLNLKGNRLIGFPSSVCDLVNLEHLNICDNPKIKILPKELCNLVLLKCFELNAEGITYPSNDICSLGTESIMQFLCTESGREYIAVDSLPVITKADPDEASGTCESPTDNFPELSASYLLYQRTKERRQKDLLLMEEALKQNYEIQSYSAADANLRRRKLLDDIAQEQERMENEIMLLQNRKDKEKQTLLDILNKVEDHSAKLIKQLMSLTDRTKNLDKMLEVLERDRLENEEMFIVKQEELEQLRKKEILEAMTEMLQCEEKQRKYEIAKNNITARLQNDENESNLKLLNLFQGRELDQQILINELLEEEQFQKKAFEALQIQKDLQHQEIAHQIHLIEKELSSLTTAEIKKRDLKIDSEINNLAEHRTALAYLLTELLNAKEQREKELSNRLNEMERQRVNEMEDFWLIQYQKLLDRKPKTLTEAETEIDQNVKQILCDADALEFLPLFAKKHITLAILVNFTMSDLKKVGVLDEDICQKILERAREYFKFMKNVKEDNSESLEFEEVPPYPPASAPPEELSPTEELLNPSAPPLSPDADIKQLWCQTECVICLDSQSCSVFLPCGHVCCCQNCSNSVETCPMCRTDIASKFILSIS